MVATNYAVMAPTSRSTARRAGWSRCARGTYSNVPISITGEGVKRVDVDELYDAPNYQPKVRHVGGKPMFLY